MWLPFAASCARSLLIAPCYYELTSQCNNYQEYVMARPNVSRQKVLDAAAELAAAKGISATTVDEIASAAGVAKGSVYYNFESKEAMYSLLITDALERAALRIRAALNNAADGTAVATVVRAFLMGIDEHPAAGKVVATEMFRLDRPWNESLAAQRDVFFSTLQDALVRDGRESSVSDAAAVFGAMLMVGFERVVFSPSMSLERAVASAAR
ncbi:TetR/AcrR family transcriptional regulator [Agrococcus casei]|uniref:TetR/AcrR family transcriptional regulator n=1 Tax=Agrococcus casei TaxID=343512 RepID=UPI003F8DC3AC